MEHEYFDKWYSEFTELLITSDTNNTDVKN